MPGPYYLTIDENSLMKLEQAVVSEGVTFVVVEPPEGDIEEAVYKIDISSKEQFVKLKNYLSANEPRYKLQSAEEYHQDNKEHRGKPTL